MNYTRSIKTGFYQRDKKHFLNHYFSVKWVSKNRFCSGEIELPEMIEIIGTLYEMEGVSKDSSSERAEKIFYALDVNGDGTVTEDEFVLGCSQDSELINLLNSSVEVEGFN